MITAENLSLSFGAESVWEKVNFQLVPGDKVGLIGLNGAGKSSLLKILSKQQAPSEGSLHIPAETRIGYLPQHLETTDTKTLIDECMVAFTFEQTLEKEISQLEHAIATFEDYESPQYMKMIQRLSDLTDKIHISDNANKEEMIERTLIGLGFTSDTFLQPTKNLSGGWRMRIELAKVLLGKPDVILLDEPTNHLDIESIQWLENHLLKSSAVLLLVSHDKIFLERLTNRIFEITNRKMEDYRLSYNAFILEKEQRKATQKAAFRNQQKLIADTEQFIERFRYKATKAKQVQSRVKMLDKIDRVENADEYTPTLNIRFPEAPRSGKIVAEISHFSKSYSSKQVLKNISLKIERGEKIALVGKNGEGKTTLLKALMGEIDYEGKISIGIRTKIAYFAQNQASMLNKEQTIWEAVDSLATGDVRTQLRSLLGAFLFPGDAINKKIKVLSGGEKTRLSILILLLKPINFLVLDEPTHHLDMLSKNILKEALKNYSGALLLVSHDRHFLSGLTDKIYECRNQEVNEHLGDVFDYLKKREMKSLREMDTSTQNQPAAPSQSTNSEKSSYLERKKEQREKQKIARQVAQTEQIIETLEAKKAEMDNFFSSSAHQATEEQYQEYKKITQQLAAEMEKWESFLL